MKNISLGVKGDLVHKSYCVLSKYKEYDDAVAYLYEMISLLHELACINTLFTTYSIQAKSLIETIQFFVIKDSMYRIYDFLQKYAFFVSTIFLKSGKKCTKWTELVKRCNKNKTDFIDSQIINLILKVSKNRSISKILKDRASMVHKRLVGNKCDYISTWVLPLDGENSSQVNYDVWFTSSKNIILESTNQLEEILEETLNRAIFTFS